MVFQADNQLRKSQIATAFSSYVDCIVETHPLETSRYLPVHKTDIEEDMRDGEKTKKSIRYVLSLLVIAKSWHHVSYHFFFNLKLQLIGLFLFNKFFQNSHLSTFSLSEQLNNSPQNVRMITNHILSFSTIFCTIFT